MEETKKQYVDIDKRMNNRITEALSRVVQVVYFFVERVHLY